MPPYEKILDQCILPPLFPPNRKFLLKGADVRAISQMRSELRFSYWVDIVAVILVLGIS